MPLNVRKIHTLDKHENDCLLTFKTSIPSIANTLEDIVASNNLYEEYAPTFYDKHGETINILLREFLRKCIKDVEHTALFT